jgi:Lamin Tail Domain
MCQMGWFRRVGGSIAVAVAALVLLPAGPASAAARVRITAVYYDPNSAGPDPATNAGRNQEYVVVHNSGTTTAGLGGWTLRDQPRPTSPSHVYRFPSSYRLRPGATVRVHTGKGSNTQTDLYWGLSFYTWGDDSDKATLKNGGGAIVDSCSWTAADHSPKFC